MKPSISETFREAGARGESAFVSFITAGFPDKAVFQESLIALDKAGSDVIEVGLPFSDPVADGPVIQLAAKQALDNGTTTAGSLEMVKEVRSEIKAPIVAMTYYNPILRMGNERFASFASDSGISGVIIPDLPPEEADDWMAAARDNDLDTIFLTSVTSPKSRKEMVAALTKGFLYYVSMTGVTGSDLSLPKETLEDIKAMREISKAPVAVGFGISTPEQAATVAKVADGVIVGSALIRKLMEKDSPKDQVETVSKLATSLKSALKNCNRSPGEVTL